MSQYIAFHKPYGVLSQFTDSAGRTTLASYITIPDIYTAGRLDYQSEGLLLLSDDGRFLQQVTDPRFDHPKTYLAQVEGSVTLEALERLRTEIVVPGLQTRLPKEVQAVSKPDLPFRPVRDYHPTTWVQIILQEGKKHQVRRMTAAVGFPTLRLVRVAIGPVVLGELEPGQWRRLTETELSQLQSQPWGSRNQGLQPESAPKRRRAPKP